MRADVPCSGGEKETGNSSDDANRRKTQAFLREDLPSCDTSRAFRGSLVTCGVTRLVASTEWRLPSNRDASVG